MLQKLSNIAGLSPTAISGAYLFGSRVYGSATEQSDWDYVLVGKGLKYREVTSDNINIHVMSDHLLRANVEDYDMRALECILAPKEAIIYERKPTKFKVKDKSKFTEKILFQVDKNWRVAKKKFNEGDVYGGKKRVYHAIRIYHFAIQLAKKGKITQWNAATKIKNDIMQDSHSDWDYFRLKYEAEKNQLKKRFLKEVKV